jgi:hypothetical protein
MAELIFRIKYSIIQVLIGVDQFVAILIKIPLYILLNHPAPNPDETISSIVGRNAVAGQRWAIISEKVINFIFGVLGDHNHCRKSIENFPR